MNTNNHETTFERENDNYRKLAEYYDEYVGLSYYNHIKDKIRFLQDQLPNESKHLDVGCGTGTIIEFSHSLGWVPKGIDISSKMIETASKKLPKDITLHCSGLFDLVSENKWNLVTANNDILNYLALDYKLEDVFYKISKILVKKGFFYADVVSEHDILENWEQSGHVHTDNKTFKCVVSYHLQDRSKVIGKVERLWYKKEKELWKNTGVEIEIIKGIKKDDILNAAKKNNLKPLLSKFPNGNIEILLQKNN